jgi:hypothetical protein
MSFLKRLLRNDHFLPLLVLFFVYSAAHGWMLLNNAVLWDDWHWEFMNMEESLWQYKAQSQPLFALIYWICHSITSSHYFFRAITFGLFYLDAVLIYKMLRQSPHFDRWGAFFVAAIFAVIPQFFSRLCFGLFTYSSCFSLFICACYLLVIDRDRKNWAWRGLTLVIFFLSFDLSSLVWAYLVPFAYLFIRQNKPFTISIKGLLRFAAGHADFLLLPFLYFFSHKVFLPKLAQFATYNDISLEGILGFAPYVTTSVRNGLINLLTPYFEWKIVVGILALVVVSSAKAPAPGFRKAAFWLAVALGSFAGFVFMVFPYAIVAHAIDWPYIEDRNSILTLLPLALLVYASISTLFSFTRIKWPAYLAFGLLLVPLGSRTATIQFSCLRGMIKQDAMVAKFREMPEVRDGRTFAFEDLTLDYLPNGTRYEDSQLVGLLREAYGTPNRCAGYPPGECQTLGGSDVLKFVYYNMTAYEPGPDQYKITIGYGPVTLDRKMTLVLALKKAFHRSSYEKILPDTLVVTATPLETK